MKTYNSIKQLYPVDFGKMENLIMAQASKSNRDILRNAVLGTKVSIKEVPVEYNGATFYLRSPTLKDRQILLSRSKDEDGGICMTSFLLWSIVLSTYDEDGSRVFEAGDFEVLINRPANDPFIETFSAAITQLMGTEDGAGNPK